MTAWRRHERIGDCDLYLGDCLEVMPELGRFDAVVTDPPYGVLSQSGSAATRRPGYNKNNGVVLWDVSLSQDMIDAVLMNGKEAMIWGGCHMSLPPTFGYLIWDKVCQGLNFGEIEFCWTTSRFAPRIFRYKAAGMDGGKQHPTQKPVALMRWCLGFLPSAETILDPFMGSGTTGVACVQLGRKFTGIELDPDYFDIACERIAKAVAEPRLPLDEPKAKPEQFNLLEDSK
jgi:DNA modification methylase